MAPTVRCPPSPPHQPCRTVTVCSLKCQPVFPWECRDQLDRAESQYNDPLRSKNRQLEDENTRLKQLLRKNGIPWSPSVASQMGSIVGVRSEATRVQPARRARASVAAASEELKMKLPYLPTEILLRVLQYAMTSPEPIIDPLSPRRTQNLTVAEKTQGITIAIGFLATCRAFYAEGRRVLWGNNSFVFTSVEALRNFSELDFSIRQGITHIKLRVIARYYDDEERKHVLTRDYHHDLKKDLPLKVALRPKEQTMARRGFRCYAWTQAIDFLDALRAPYDPKHDKKLARPRLLPNLETMRIDFVNFLEYFLPFSETELHDMAAHDLGSTLNELAVTGLPCCEVGMKASADLAGMVRDNGLFLDANPAFVQMKNSIKKLEGIPWAPKVMRAWRVPLKAARSAALEAVASGSPSSSAAVGSLPSVSTDLEQDGDHNHASRDIPSAPDQEGHPEPTKKRKRKTVWKLVPKGRDREERGWIEFDRNSGFPVKDPRAHMDGSDDESDGVWCPKCGQFHGPLDYDEWDF